MKIVIVGAGFTGIQLAKILINEKNQVTLIDNNEEVIRHQDNRLSGRAYCRQPSRFCGTYRHSPLRKAPAQSCG